MTQTPTHMGLNLPHIQPSALGKVAVLMGGASGERAISLLSGNGVLNALLEAGVNAFGFDPHTQSVAELVLQKPDRAIVCLHGRWGEDGCIQGLLELLRIPYTGSGVMASAIAMDKVTTKRLWLAEGLSTPQYRRVNTLAALTHACHALGLDQGLSVAVKPACEGSSLGFTEVKTESDIHVAWDKTAGLKTHDRVDLIVEQFIQGRELTIAILQAQGMSHALPIVEIIAPAGNYDYENKYFKDDTRYDCPAALSPGLTRAIQALSVKAFDAISCSGWGRVDVMLDQKTNTPYLLEVNTAPGMTSHSLVPMAAKSVGLAYPDLCMQLLHQASLKT